MSRDTRSSYPLSSTHAVSPTQDRGTHTSSIFPYSTARPPTNYSAQSWLPQDPHPPPLPTSPAAVDANPFGGIEEEDELEDPRETPLYARSDWEGEQETGPISGANTAWSRSSFAGMTTAAPTTTFGGLEEIREVRDEEEMPVAEDVAEAGRIRSPRRRPMSMGTSMRQRFTGHASEASLPSVINLEDLKLSSAVANPFADPVVELVGRRRTSYLPEPTPNLDVERASPDLMSPAAHERLGRMSVAPARYTLPPVSTNSPTHGSGEKAPSFSGPVSIWGTARRHFHTYRPFINTFLSIICVILLTMAIQTLGPVSTIVVVQPGAFSVDAANGATVGLGAFGWCQRGVNK